MCTLVYMMLTILNYKCSRISLGLFFFAHFDFCDQPLFVVHRLLPVVLSSEIADWIVTKLYMSDIWVVRYKKKGLKNLLI